MFSLWWKVCPRSPMQNKTSILLYWRKDKWGTKTIEHAPTNNATNIEMPISFNALIGTTSPRVMLVRGMLKQHPVIILIDSGSTHNFLRAQLATWFDIPIQTTDELYVTVANGETLLSHGVCPDISFSIQQTRLATNFYLIEFGGCDISLGAEWLQTLGPILWDFSKKSMQFKINGQEIAINGMTPSKASKTTSNKASCALLYMSA